MADRAEFDEFVRMRSARLLRTAYLLTRDHGLAEDVLQTALARSWRYWPRIEGDPEPYVRRTLVNVFNTWWRRPWMKEHPSDSLPDNPVEDRNHDDRRELLQALGRLPRQQRTVLVLRYYEDMTESQIADTMSISEGSVKGYAAKALAKLRIDPALLALVVVDTPQGTERVSGVHSRIRNRRNLVTATAAAVVAVLVLLVGYALSPLAKKDDRPPVQPSPSPSVIGQGALDEYVMGYRMRAAKPPFHPGADAGELVYTPTTLDLSVTAKCINAGTVQLFWALMVADREVAEGSCETSGLYSHQAAQAAGRLNEGQLRAAGAVTGRPITFHMRLKKVEGFPSVSSYPPYEDIAAPHDFQLSYAIGEPVPWDQFVFPSRPAYQVPITNFYPLPDTRFVLSKHGRHELTFKWHACLGGQLRFQSPGTIRLKVDGKVIVTLTSWDYRRLNEVLVGPAIFGDENVTATLAVESEHVEDWAVILSATEDCR